MSDMDIEQTMEAFRRQLGTSNQKPKAYIFDRTSDRCQLIEDISWPELENYDVVHIPDDEILPGPLVVDDLVLMGDPLSAFAGQLVTYVTAAGKQLVMRKNDFYVVKPLQA